MDVVSERDSLTNFLDSLGGGEGEEEGAQRELNNYTTPSYNNEEDVSSVIWSDITYALNQWTQRILDTETCLGKTVGFREKIEASLHRQQLDGFLNHQDIAELRYIADLWAKLLNSISSYAIGCEFVKRDIVTSLLGLHKLRQITDGLFIKTCLKL